MRLAALACTLVACGRFSFTPVDGVNGDGGASSGSADALGTGIDGATDRPNRVFVTRGTTTGALGGVDGADAICAATAASAGLPGTFIALLSDLTHDARQRLSGSRGWIRTGDDVPVADRSDALFGNGVMFNPIDRDENGISLGPPTLTTFAWIGATTIGGSVENCQEWTLANGAFTMHGRIGGAMTEVLTPFNVYTFSCGNQAALTCFEIGHDYPVSPVMGSGRIAFMATASVHGGGLAQLDGQCQSEASAAGLAGTYLAAVAAQGTTIASRFPNGVGWRRPDGTQIAATSTAMFDGTEPLSFINQYADGTYVNDAIYIRTGGDPLVAGSNASTCNSWTSTSGSNMSYGNKIASADLQWSVAQAGCVASMHTICLQQ